MVPRLYFIFLLTLAIGPMSSQEFLDHENVWIVKRIGIDSNGETVNFFYQYQFAGTELIDSLEYSILTATATDSLVELAAELEAGQYYRAEAQRVYYRDSLDGPDVLLFDMGAQHGDTLLVGPLSEAVVVTAVDTITLDNGDLRKRITVLGNNSFIGMVEQEWVQGIGSLQGTMTGFLALNGLMELQCLTRAGVVEYINGDCTLTSLGGEMPHLTVSIFPNPARTHIWIDHAADSAIGEVVIYALMGLSVRRIAGPHLSAIDISALAAGTYFLHIRTEDGVTQVVPLIKQ